MDVLELYKSLPQSTISEVARRTGQSVQTTTNRMLRKHADTWRVALEVLNALDERIDSTTALITELIAAADVDRTGIR